MTDYPLPSFDDDTEDLEAELALPIDTGQERSVARRLALQMLYEIDCTDHPMGEVIASQMSRHVLREALTGTYTIRLVKGVLSEVERMDMILQTVAQEWPLDQVAIIDRNILRIAVYEYTRIGGLAAGIVADEAMNLARQFGSDSSLRFVNGVLGAVFSDEKRLQAMLAVEIPDDDDDDDDEDDEFDEDE